jgi:hypothetical protein
MDFKVIFCDNFLATKEMGQAGRLSYLHTLNLNSSTSPSRTT